MSDSEEAGDGARLEPLRDRVEGTLYSVVRFSADDFEVVYADEATREMYADDEAMLEHFRRIFDYVGIDFAEKALFSDMLLPERGTVRYMTTCMATVKLVRIYAGSEGVLLTVDPEEPVPRLADVVEERLL